MSLSDLVIETQEIPVSDKAFSVRGLCFNDLTELVRVYGEELDEVIDTLKSGADFSEIDDNELMQKVLQELPHVVAHAISLAADEPEEKDKVLKLSFAIQLKAVKAIWRLTVDQAGGLKKLIGSLMELVREIRVDVKTLNTGTFD